MLAYVHMCMPTHVYMYEHRPASGRVRAYVHVYRHTRVHIHAHEAPQTTSSLARSSPAAAISALHVRVYVHAYTCARTYTRARALLVRAYSTVARSAPLKECCVRLVARVLGVVRALVQGMNINSGREEAASSNTHT